MRCRREWRVSLRGCFESCTPTGCCCGWGRDDVVQLSPDCLVGCALEVQLMVDGIDCIGGGIEKVGAIFPLLSGDLLSVSASGYAISGFERNGYAENCVR